MLILYLSFYYLGLSALSYLFFKELQRTKREILKAFGKDT